MIQFLLTSLERLTNVPPSHPCTETDDDVDGGDGDSVGGDVNTSSGRK